VLALALAGGHAAQGHSEEHADAAKKSGLSEQRLAFHDEMRRLWEDHITWTRLFIVSASDDLPDTPATTQRLLRNQEDIGDAVKPFYAGRRASDSPPCSRSTSPSPPTYLGRRKRATRPRSNGIAAPGIGTPTRSPTSSARPTRATGLGARCAR
jgi:hypothetical protein